jgi:UDPglucose 6-dehydrogenase
MALRPLQAGPLVVVDKSTVPVGTSARVAAAISARTDRAFEVVSNPEFLREGCAIQDFVRPDRVVVGCQTAHAEGVMKALYGPFLEASGGQWLCMDPASAELTKYAANAMLALRISFINEIAALCERVGANVECVRDGIGSDHRIGKFFLNPGPGFGGSCFPKDLQALLKVGRENGQPLRALEATVEANRHQKQVLALKIRKYFKCEAGSPAPLTGRRFAIWGLAFKAHTDDIREAMALELIDSLLALGAELVVHDFEAMPNVKAKLGDRIRYVEDPMAACDGADALLIATEWPQYAKADLRAVAGRLKHKIMFDGRNLFRPEAMKADGWTYHSIGRLPVSPDQPPANRSR